MILRDVSGGEEVSVIKFGNKTQSLQNDFYAGFSWFRFICSPAYIILLWGQSYFRGCIACRVYLQHTIENFIVVMVLWLGSACQWNTAIFTSFWLLRRNVAPEMSNVAPDNPQSEYGFFLESEFVFVRLWSRSLKSNFKIEIKSDASVNCKFNVSTLVAQSLKILESNWSRSWIVGVGVESTPIISAVHSVSQI